MFGRTLVLGFINLLKTPCRAALESPDLSASLPSRAGVRKFPETPRWRLLCSTTHDINTVRFSIG